MYKLFFWCLIKIVGGLVVFGVTEGLWSRYLGLESEINKVAPQKYAHSHQFFLEKKKSSNQLDNDVKICFVRHVNHNSQSK